MARLAGTGAGATLLSVAVLTYLLGSSTALNSSLLGPGGWERTWDVAFEVEDHASLVEKHCADVDDDVPCYYALALAAGQDSVDISPNWATNLHNYGATYQRYLERMLRRFRRESRWHHRQNRAGTAPYPPPKLLEIGLGCGMRYGPGRRIPVWKTFVPGIEVWEVEHPAAAQCARSINSSLDGRVLLGDQSDPAFLARVLDGVRSSGRPFDMIVDDAKHWSWHQQVSLATLFPCGLRAPGGTYIIEDLEVNLMGEPLKNASSGSPGDDPQQRGLAGTTTLELFGDIVRDLNLAAPIIARTRKRDANATAHATRMGLSRFVASVDCAEGICALTRNSVPCPDSGLVPKTSEAATTARPTNRVGEYHSMRGQLGVYDGSFVWEAHGDVPSLHFVRRGIKYPVQNGCATTDGCDEDPCSLAVVVSPAELRHIPTHERGEVYECHRPPTEQVHVTTVDGQGRERQIVGDLSVNLDHQHVARQVCANAGAADGVGCLSNVASEVRRLLHRLDTPGMLARTLRREGIVWLRGAFADDLEQLGGLRRVADEWITRAKNGGRSSGTRGRLLSSAFSYDRFAPYFSTFRSNRHVLNVLEHLRPASWAGGGASKGRFRALEHYDIGVNNVCNLPSSSPGAQEPSTLWHRDSVKYLQRNDAWGLTPDGVPVHEIFKLLVYLQDHSAGGGLHYRKGTHASNSAEEQRPPAYDQVFPRFGDAVIMDQRLVHCAQLFDPGDDGGDAKEDLNRYLVAVGFGTDSPATDEFEQATIVRQEYGHQRAHDEGQLKGLRRVLSADLLAKLERIETYGCDRGGETVPCLPEETRKLIKV